MVERYLKQMTPDEIANYKAGRDLRIVELTDEQAGYLAFLNDLAHYHELTKRGMPVDPVMVDSFEEEYNLYEKAPGIGGFNDLEKAKVARRIESIRELGKAAGSEAVKRLA